MSRASSKPTSFALALPLAVVGTLVMTWLLLGTFSWYQPQGSDFSAFFALEGSRLRDLVENFLLPVPAAFLFSVWLRGRDWSWGEATLGGLVPLLLVAFATEVLQWWIPGRNASLWDAILMSMGAASAALFGALVSSAPQGRALLSVLDELKPAWLLVALWLCAWVLPGHLELSRNMLMQGLAPILGGGFNPYAALWVAVGWLGVGLLLE
ncbi:MAG: VanZ family protein, partial [Gammaproteobacteria bacterium]